jgi:hypothetical protein
MSDPIERMLSELPLREPPAELDRRVMAALSEHETIALSSPRRKPGVPRVPGVQRPARQRRPVLATLGWLGGSAALAALLAMAITTSMRQPDPIQPPAAPLAAADKGFDPVRIEQTSSSVTPAGIVMLDERTPARRYVERTYEHVQLIDEANNIRIEYTTPRESYVLIPVESD